MRNALLLLVLILASSLEVTAQSTFFKIRVENTGKLYDYADSGVFNTPVGMTSPGPLLPGSTYSFTFVAPAGHRVSFATMFVQSNDLFYGPAASGLALWDAQGQPRSGDITSEIILWDAGTEMNEEPGLGGNQPLRQASANSGPVDSNSAVRLVADSYTYPAVGDVLDVDLVYNGDNSFTISIMNVSTDMTLQLSDATTSAAPLAPGVYVVHAEGVEPLYSADQPDLNAGLEAIAEDGDPSSLGLFLADRTGVSMILAPGVWAVHQMTNLLFEDGAVDPGQGLEKLAEDGDPAPLHLALSQNSGISTGVFSIPVGGSSPGAVTPGSAYEFVVIATPSDRVSFATMFVQSNDLFFAPGQAGLSLFDGNGAAMSGEITDQIYFWDAGTEVNEGLGVGPNQAPRQSGGNTGAADPDATVRMATGTGQTVSELLSVTVTPLTSVTLDVTIENVSTGTTLHTSTGADLDVPLAPGVFAVHTSPAPLFSDGMADRGLGLEAIAEDGDPSGLGPVLASTSGLISGVFNTPVGAAGPGALPPGSSYAFTVDAAPGAHLSFATMFVHSNDLFYAPAASGISLWDENGMLRMGDITSEFSLWDAGTELNEEPGEGANQAPRQTGANTGPVDTDTSVRLVSDAYTYPGVASVIRVTISQATATGIEDERGETPTTVSLHQNYPNPFNPTTQIEYTLAESSSVRLTIYDVLGREVRHLASGFQSAGTYGVTWNGLDEAGQSAATGIYFYHLEAGNTAVTRKMTLLR